MIVPDTSPELRALGEIFEAQGREVVYVGGPPRDWILDIVPKDIDLATSATPDEQMAIYASAGIRWHETGLKHGTITVVLAGVPHEITSYRRDVETDGRHAQVEYTRDLLVDLERRDLTINAMAMRFDGTIVDPFGGEADARAGIVRFVGDPDRRLAEDYLRILRWVRFTGRFLRDGSVPDPESQAAVMRNVEGLSRISVERIWSETSRIVTGPNASRMVELVAETGISSAIGLPDGNARILDAARTAGADAASAIGAYLADPAAAKDLAKRWKMSAGERDDAVAMADRISRSSYGVDDARRDMVDGTTRTIAALALRLRGLEPQAREVESWPIPVFPVTGDDLIAQGMVQGLALGQRMRTMRDAWIRSGYSLDRTELLETAAA